MSNSDESRLKIHQRDKKVIPKIFFDIFVAFISSDNALGPILALSSIFGCKMS